MFLFKTILRFSIIFSYFTIGLGMSDKKIVKGPDLEANFYVTENQIYEIKVQVGEEGKGFSWKIWGGNIQKGVVHIIESWLACYLEKKASKIKLPLDFPKLQPFSFTALKCIEAVPFGESRSYAQIAALSGSAGASRAVGTACKFNRFLLVIPCHRIISSNNKICGYSQGLEIKKRLLAFEGISYKE